MKPLFIPLKTEYFRAFERGDKTVEFRRYGSRWNERVCAPGRRVILSHGYSGARLVATIASMDTVSAGAIGSVIYSPDQLLAAIYLVDIGSP